MDEYKEKKSYIKESKKFFIRMYTEILAHELYLDQKYHIKQNNDINKVWNSCYNAGWILNSNEVELLIKEATKIANKKYDFKIKELD